MKLTSRAWVWCVVLGLLAWHGGFWRVAGADMATTKITAVSDPATSSPSQVCVVQIMASGTVLSTFVDHPTHPTHAVLVLTETTTNVPIWCQDLISLGLGLANQETSPVHLQITVLTHQGTPLCTRGPFTLSEHGARGVAFGSDCTDACKRAVLIGSNIDLSTDKTNQRDSPAIAYNGLDNEYMVAWNDGRKAGGSDVFGQRVSATGALLGANFPIIELAQAQIHPFLAHNRRDNEYLVAWRTQEFGAFNQGYGRLIAADGRVMSHPFFISNAGFESSLAYNAIANEYFYVGRSFEEGPIGIRGQRVSVDGKLVGPNIGIAMTGDPAPAGPVVYNPNTNEYFATWRDQIEWNLKGRRISAHGTFVGHPIILSSVMPESGGFTAFDPTNDRYLVVFGLFQESKILGQFVAGSGQLIGENFPIATGLARHVSPVIAHSSRDNVFFIVWIQSGNVIGQVLSANGSALGNPLVITRRTAVGGSPPSLALNATTGEFFIAWTDDRNISQGERDIFGQSIGIRPCTMDMSPLSEPR